MRNAFQIDGATAIVAVSYLGKPYSVLMDSDCLSLLDHASKVTLKPAKSLPYPYVRRKRKEVGRNDEYLHVLIAGHHPDLVVDHKDGNVLDCRKANLRTVTHAINVLNRSRPSLNKLGVRGLSYEEGAWRARIRKRSLGSFPDPISAADAIYRELLCVDPVSATNFLRSLPATPPPNPDYPNFAPWFKPTRNRGVAA